MCRFGLSNVKYPHPNKNPVSDFCYRVGRNLVLYQAWGGTQEAISGLPFRNKADVGKRSLIWTQKMRIRPQCCVTTPLWVPGADSGQREENEIVGKIRTENDCSARPWGRRAVTLVSESCLLVRLYRPISKCFT
jgi:hypothetical protein